MTATKGTDAKLLVDEFDFSADTAGFTVTVAMTEQDCTGLQATAMLYQAILPSTAIEHNGYLRTIGAAGAMEQELKDRLGTGSAYVAALLGTGTAACPAYVLDGTFGSTLNFGAPATGLMTINGAWGKGSGGHRGRRIVEGVLDAVAAGTAYDLGAAGSAGGEAYLFVQDITGTATDAVIKVQSSATEGGTYADEATFTFSAVGGYKAAMTGTINRWLRVNVTDLGGADDFTVVAIVCVDGVTQ